MLVWRPSHGDKPSAVPMGFTSSLLLAGHFLALRFLAGSSAGGVSGAFLPAKDRLGRHVG
ncbi:MAG: hypothetical protein HZA46_14105 [Planctomycetales bacterium]|nr:hypothetical protein [Planctomycetales bacterium]